MSQWPEITTEQIVARLRMIVAEPDKWCETDRHFVEDAAAEIERLRRDYSAAEQDHVDAVVAYSEAEQEIERLRAELRTYTGDGHNTKGEPCTQNTPS